MLRRVSTVPNQQSRAQHGWVLTNTTGSLTLADTLTGRTMLSCKPIQRRNTVSLRMRASVGLGHLQSSLSVTFALGASASKNGVIPAMTSGGNLDTTSIGCERHEWPYAVASILPSYDSMSCGGLKRRSPTLAVSTQSVTVPFRMVQPSL